MSAPAPPIAPCTCEHCSPASDPLGRFALWFGLISFVLIPGRVLLHFVGLQ